MQNLNGEIEEITRKEIFEYLRNVQKATEVRSRLSGINIWVLLGAISFIAWSLLDENNPAFSESCVLFSLAICQILVLALMLVSVFQISSRSSDIRFLPEWVTGKSSLSKFWCAQFFWYATPFFVLGIYHRFSFMTVVIPILMLLAAYKELFSEEDDLRMSLRGPKKEWFLEVLFFLILLVLVIWESRKFTDIYLELTRGEFRQCVLAVVLYFLVILLISRALQNNLDLWTYQLERKLILGTCQNHEALKIIESHSIGARVQEVIDNRRQEILKLESSISELIKQAEEKFRDIEKISDQYIHERREQLGELTKPIKAELDALNKAVKEFDAFRIKLSSRARLVRDPQIEKLSENINNEITAWNKKAGIFNDEILNFSKRLAKADNG